MNNKNSNVFIELHDLVNAAGEVIEGFVEGTDSSHGLIISAGYQGAEEAKLMTNIKIWGNAENICDLLLQVAINDADFGRLVSRLGIRLATYRLEKMNQLKAAAKALHKPNNKIILPAGFKK